MADDADLRDGPSTPQTEGPRESEATTSPSSTTTSPSTSVDTDAAAAAPEPGPAPPTLEQARVFLRDTAVRHEPRPRKAAFLATKGLAAAQIDQLLDEEDEAKKTQKKEEEEDDEAGSADKATLATLPPIVTYPEFLARPPPPPPLVTPRAVANVLYGSAAAASLLYAAARLVLAPMADALTDARADLHHTAADNLDRLLDQLAGVVSAVPEAAKATTPAAARHDGDGDGDDAAKERDNADRDSVSSYGDPTEVFHRDMGVQTSLPPSPALPPSVRMDSTVPSPSPLPLPAAGAAAAESPSARQADRLARLVASVRGLRDDWAGPPDVLADLRTAVDGVRDDVDKLSRPPAYTYGGSGSGSGYAGLYGYGSSVTTGSSGGKYPGYVTTTRNEPDDEIRKAKENIRRVKGALLSTRTFPTAR